MKVQHLISFFRNRVLIILSGFLLWGLISSCGEEFPEPLFTNSVIQGKINLGFSTDGPLEDFTITASGPYKNKTSLTNSSGNFLIDGLGNGTYRLEISKEGYGTKYEYGIQLFGNDTVGLFIDEICERVYGEIPKLLTVETKNTSYSWLSDNEIVITTNKTSGQVPVRVFMSESEKVSYKNYKWTNNVHSLYRNGYDNLMLMVHDIPFYSGQKIYLRLYICNLYESGYLDYYTGLWTFSTLEPDKRSDVMSFIMP